MSFDKVQEIADSVGGKIIEAGVLPDGSGFAAMSMPLPKRHWIYGGAIEQFEAPPMPFRMGSDDQIIVEVVGPTSKAKKPTVEDLEKILSSTPQGSVQILPDGQVTVGLTKNEIAERIRAAGRYAVRAATMNGSDMDFDPDALIQNLVVGFLGYWTETGLTDDEWANPKDWRDALKELPRDTDHAGMEPTGSL